MSFRDAVLRTFYRVAPFDLQGDLELESLHDRQCDVSCLIISQGRREEELESLLFHLSRQTLEKKQFEIVLLNDGGGNSIEQLVRKYERHVSIVYLENAQKNGYLGKNRNKTVQNACGTHLVFLDDDTRILDRGFLEKVLELFSEGDWDMIMPRSRASYGLVKERYDYLDPYSFSTRCSIYKRRAIVGIGGFLSSMTTFEDIELGIRLSIKGIKALKTDKVSYFHPPLYYHTLDKAYVHGQTIRRMRQKYSFLVWLLVYINALRFLALIVVPTKVNRQWFKHSWGILIGSFMERTEYY